MGALTIKPCFPEVSDQVSQHFTRRRFLQKRVVDFHHISFFGSVSGAERFEVSLHNPLTDPGPAWRFKTELWEIEGRKIVGRSPAQAEKADPYRGLAALEAVKLSAESQFDLLTRLQEYVIYSPTTTVLRGVAPETQPRNPLGLYGGNLPAATSALVRKNRKDSRSRKICQDVLGLIDWAKSFGASSSDELLLSPAAASSSQVVRFRDRFMREGRNVLSGYDASEGALYVLFLAALAGDDKSPRLCSVDNADHGLNPRLARALIGKFCQWYLTAETERQVLLTTHNPLVLDGLPLTDDRVRLFTVSRTRSGRTSVRRVVVTDDILKKAEKGWSLSRMWTMGHLGGVPDV